MSIFDDLITAYDEQKQLIDRITEELTPFMAEAVALLGETLITGNKIITLASSDVQPAAAHVAERLIHPTAFERPSLPAINLSYTGNAFSVSSPEDSAWVQQLSALAQHQDCLLIFAAHYNTQEIEAVIQHAAASGIHVVCICDERHQTLSELVSSDQVCIQLSSKASPNYHFLVASFLVELIEKQLFGT